MRDFARAGEMFVASASSKNKQAVQHAKDHPLALDRRFKSTSHVATHAQQLDLEIHVTDRARNQCC